MNLNIDTLRSIFRLRPGTARKTLEAMTERGFTCKPPIDTLTDDECDELVINIYKALCGIEDKPSE